MVSLNESKSEGSNWWLSVSDGATINSFDWLCLDLALTGWSLVARARHYNRRTFPSVFGSQDDCNIHSASEGISMVAYPP